MHKRISWIAMACLLTACGSKSPGMSKEDAAKALSEQAEQQAIAEKIASVAVAEFPEGYTPPAGIKYQPRIVTTGVTTLNVEAALKKIRPVKVSELGKLEVHRTGAEARPRTRAEGLMIAVRGNYVLVASQGLFLFDKDFKYKKQLFKNEIEYVGGGTFIRQAVMNAYYDEAMGQIRCFYLAADDKAKGYSQNTFLVALPYEAMLAASEPWTAENITSRLQVDKFMMSSNIFTGMEGGYVKAVPLTSRFYTHGVKGDTLCCFNVGDQLEYKRKGPIGNGEWSNSYLYNGKLRLRMSYDNTVYQQNDASTLQAIYKLNFGSMRRLKAKEIVVDHADVSGAHFIGRWFETDRHLYIKIDNTYILLYNKQTKELISLPPAKEEDFLYFEADDASGMPFFPQSVVNGIPLMYKSGKEMKDEFPGYVKSAGWKDVSDNELFIITVK